MEENAQLLECLDELPLRVVRVNEMSNLGNEIETRICRRSLGRNNILEVADRVQDNWFLRWRHTHSNGHGKRRLV